MNDIFEEIKARVPACWWSDGTFHMDPDGVQLLVDDKNWLIEKIKELELRLAAIKVGWSVLEGCRCGPTDDETVCARGCGAHQPCNKLGCPHEKHVFI